MSKRSRRRHRVQNTRRKNPQRVENATVTSTTGQGQRQDQGRDGRTRRSSMHPLDRYASDYQRAREWAELYYKEWTAQKIVDIPVQDTLRKDWEYKGLDEIQTKTIERRLRKLLFRRSLRQGLKLERLVGGAVVLMGLKSANESDVATPLDLDTVRPGDLFYTNVFPRTRITVLEKDRNPLSPTYGKPEVYRVHGYPVHVSRLLVFDGDPLVDNETSDLGFVNRSHDGFGVSVLSPIYDDIIRSVGSRQAAVHLIHRASILLILNDNQKSMMSTQGGEEALAKLDAMADQINMYQAAMIDGKNVKLDKWSAAFGSVPELMEKYLQIISAASDIPATRFLGQAPGGLNATGASDLENYYNNIDDKRENRLRPQLEKLMQVLIRSELPDVDPDSVDIKFSPLWNSKEIERSQARSADATAIATLVNADIIGQTQARNEASERGLLLATDKEDLPDDNFEGDLGMQPGQETGPGGQQFLH